MTDKAKTTPEETTAEVVETQPQHSPPAHMTAPATPALAETLLSQAIDKGVSVETMEKLMVIRRELRAEAAKAAFDDALSSFQGSIKSIEKTKIVKDKYGKERYRFAPIDSIVDQVKEPLSKNGLSYSIETVCEPNQVTATCKVKHLMGHTEESSLTVPIDKDAYMNPAQKVASANTFAKRYAFCNALGIMTGDADDDSQATEEQAPPKPKAAPAQAAAKAPAPAKTQPKNPLLQKNREQLNRELYALLKKYGMPADEVKKKYKVESMTEVEDNTIRSMIVHLRKRTQAGEVWEDPNLPKILVDPAEPGGDKSVTHEIPPKKDDEPKPDDTMTPEEAAEALGADMSAAEEIDPNSAAAKMMKGGFTPPGRK